MKYGYARVSTTGQDLTIQKDALNAYGCDMVVGEQLSATSRQGRVELDRIIAFARQGDKLVVTRVDRLARSMGDLQDIVRELRSKGVSLVMTEQSVDTSTAAGKAFLDMLGVFAEFETNIRAERQAEGIAKAKAEGRYSGRAWGVADGPAFIAAVQAHGVRKAAREAGIGKSAAYRWLEANAPHVVGESPFQARGAAAIAEPEPASVA